MLEEKVKLLSGELDFLKNIFLTHAGEIKSKYIKVRIPTIRLPGIQVPVNRMGNPPPNFFDPVNLTD